MSVVEIRKTKTREQGSYYCTLLLVLLYSTQGKTQGGYNVGQRTPLQGYRSLRRVPVSARVSRECPGSLPCLFTGTEQVKFTVPITDGYKYMLIRIIGTEETAESAFEHGGRLLPNL